MQPLTLFRADDGGDDGDGGDDADTDGIFTH